MNKKQTFHERLLWTSGIAIVAIFGGIIFMYGTFWEGFTQNAHAASSCPKLQPQPPYESSYQGQLIDTHMHIAHLPDDPISSYKNKQDLHPILGVNVKLEDYICMMETEETDKIFAFFPVWDPIRPALQVVKRAIKKYPDKFVPFIMPPDSDNDPNGFPTVTAKKLQRMLKIYPGLFRGYGEIGLYARPGGARELPPDSQRLREIYPVLRKHKLVAYFHLGEGQKASFEKVLDENPDINFIWHGDQLISHQPGGTQDLSQVEAILQNHKNVFYGIDELYGDVWLLRPEVGKEKFLAHFSDYELLLQKDLSTWKGFIERHPDQVLWGTDRGGTATWTLDPEVGLTLTRYSRAFIGRLAPEVQENFAYKNAQRLLGEEE